MSDLPKYALWEIERRFLVDPAKLPALDPASERRIKDLYLDGGRLRLRAVTWTASGLQEFTHDPALSGWSLARRRS